MLVERFAIKKCCGSMGVSLKLGKTLTANFFPLLIEKGFTERKSFTSAGIFYIESEALIATGAMNSNILQISCKKKDCNSFINDFEEILKTME